ncbi:MAG: Crp/Fnr family transcriptional regulator [Bacteroidota bacterium]
MDSFEILKQKLEQASIPKRTKVFKRGAYIKRPNTVDTAVYFVVSGSLRVFFSEGEDEHILYFGYKNSLITDIDSFFSEEKSELAIQALKRTQVCYVSKQDFMRFIHSSEENRSLWDRVVADLIRFQTEREKDLFAASPVKRYERTMTRRPDLFQEIPNKYIASYLRMTPETLSRIRKY